MLKIVAFLAIAVGVLLLLVVVLLVLALLPRARVEILKAERGPLRLTVGYGFLRFLILPREKKPKPEKTGPPEKPKPEKPPKEKKGGFSVREIDIGDAVCLALDMLLELRNRLVIHCLRADVLLATGDAAKTGILLGRIAAVSGMIFPLLEQNFVIPDFHVSVDGDFQAEESTLRASFRVEVSLRPIHLPLIALKYHRRLWKLVRGVLAGLPKKEPADKSEENAKNKSMNTPEKENVT